MSALKQTTRNGFSIYMYIKFYARTGNKMKWKFSNDVLKKKWEYVKDESFDRGDGYQGRKTDKYSVYGRSFDIKTTLQLLDISKELSVGGIGKLSIF